MSRSTFTPKALALFACAIPLLASIGCSPEAPTAPSLEPLNVVASPNFIRILSTSKGAEDIQLAAGVSKMISAEQGGVVSDGRVTLEFPPFALSEDTEITIESLDDGTLGVELGPHGIKFDRPVVMIMDLRDTTAEGKGKSAQTIWWNEDESWWEKMPKSESDDNEIKTELEHFSKYASELGG